MYIISANIARYNQATSNGTTINACSGKRSDSHICTNNSKALRNCQYDCSNKLSNGKEEITHDTSSGSFYSNHTANILSTPLRHHFRNLLQHNHQTVHLFGGQRRITVHIVCRAQCNGRSFGERNAHLLQRRLIDQHQLVDNLIARALLEKALQANKPKIVTEIESSN